MAAEKEDGLADRRSELQAEYGEDWEEQWKPGTFGCHELLDRTYLLSILLDAVLTHPSCALNAEWYRLADTASDAIATLYQSVGASHLGDDGVEG